MTNDKMAIKIGSGAAALVAAGIGTFAMGLFTTLSEVVGPIHDLMNLYGPVGPLSGKTTFSYVIWLVSWFFLNNSWKDQEKDLAKAFRWTLILVVVGLLLAFPPIFTAFVSE